MERRLLEELEGAVCVRLAADGMDRAEAESRRRAGRSLERKGLAAVRPAGHGSGGHATALLMRTADAIAWDHGQAVTLAESSRMAEERAARTRERAEADAAAALEAWRGIRAGD